MKRIFTLILCLTGLLTVKVFGQTTINTTVGSTGYTATNGVGGISAVTFDIENTSGADILLTDVGSYFQVASNGATVTLWYSSTSLSGAATIATPDWTSIGTGTITVTADGIVPCFTGLTFLIPNNAQYRFAVQSSNSIRYSGAGIGAADPDVFTVSGVTLKCGEAQVAGANVGYAGLFPTPPNNPRWFTGYITFAPAGPCTTPPTPGTVTTTSNPVCVGSNFTLSLSGGTTGTGQTYQWESSPDNVTWTPISGATNSSLQTSQSVSTYYRAIVTCGAVAATSAGLQVTSPPPVSGTYAINSSVVTGGTNFQTFAEAITYIGCGLNGPVIFNVAAGSGPYNEQVVIPNIASSSAINTITINGNGATVNFASADANARSVIKLDGADYVTIKDLLIDASGGTYGWGLLMTNQANNDSIVNCTITTDAIATSTNFAGLMITGSGTALTAGNNANNAVVMGNTINGGYYSIANYGTVSSPFTTNNQFIGNTINDFYLYGIYNYGSINPVISGNTIQRPLRTIVGGPYGIYLTTYSAGSLVEKNRIQNLFGGNPTSTAAAYGIYVAGDGSTALPNKIINNLISDINSEGIIYGIYNTGASSMQVYHNTISLDNTLSAAGAAYGFYQVTSDTGIMFENNIISITRGGSGAKYGIYMSTPTTPLVSNYNDVYVNSAGAGVQAFGYNTSARFTIADWQTATGQDLNSLSIDPMFVGIGTDYTPTAVPLNNRGTPVGVLTDITGAPRSATNPDIGAYEFTVSGCTSPPVAGDATAIPDTVCYNFPFTLQVTNNSAGLGQVYQWQSGPSAAGPWTNLGGSISNPDTTIAATTSMWYRAAVTCGASTTYSTPVFITVNPPVTGTYTIDNNNTTGGTNFQSFADAIGALKCGVNGPVVFNVVAGSGPYVEQVSIPVIAGTSATNTVTFNGNGTTISFASADANARHVVMLNGADYVTIKDFVIDATLGTYGWGVFLTNAADNDSIVNCTITTDAISTSTNFVGIAISGSVTSPTTAGNNANNAVIMGNTITGGYYSITNYGNTAAPFTNNNHFINNTVSEYYFYGIYSYGSTNPVISGNTIQRPTRIVVGSSYSIYAATYTSGALIEGNKVNHLYDGALTSTGVTYGIYLSGDGTATAPNRIINNVISDISSEGTIYGIYNGGAAYMQAYHNTISLDYGASAAGITYGLYIGTADTGIAFENNLITITRGGSGIKYGIYTPATTIPLVINYNDVYVNSSGSGAQGFGFSGSGRITLADWQTATGYDLNSASLDPVYTAAGSDYTPTNASLNNRGTPVGVLTDITGAPRSPSNPDVGAYEFTIPGCTAPPVAGNATASFALVCVNGSVTLSLLNNSVGIGQTYQWQTSPDNVTWTNIGAPLNNTDTIVIVTANTYYRAGVTCGASTVYSASYLVNVTPAFAGGSYTINSALPTGGTNFATFGDAVNAIKCGITASVTFNVVAGSGPYNEQVVIPVIAGTSATSTVTFIGNGAALNFASADANARAVLKLEGADYVTIRDLVIDASGGTYGWGIHMTSHADNDSIVNCTITTDGTATTTNFVGIVISGSSTTATGIGNNANNAVIMGNTINNGYYSITNYGPAAPPFADNNKFINNTLNDFYLYGLYNYGCINSLISGNIIQRTVRTTVGTAYGIYLGLYTVGALVEKNRIRHLFDAATTSASTTYAIYAGGDGTAASPNKIVNNLVSAINSEGTIYGIYNSGAAHMKAYHNTFSLDNTAAGAGTTYGIYISTADTGMVFMNNIVSITRGGTGAKYGIYQASLTLPSLTSNNNDVYVSSAGAGVQAFGYYGAAQTTLADWNTATGQDLNSVTADPMYNSPSTEDYTPTDTLIDNKGTPVGVLEDILALTRSSVTPDVGAYEFNTTVAITLKDLTADIVRKDVQVKWLTAAEINFNHFEVERSLDGRSFEKAGSVQGRASGSAYSFTDVEIISHVPANALIYYRLKLVDNDGRYSYSPVVMVKTGKGNAIVSVYPNPVVKDLSVKVSLAATQQVSIKMTDQAGRKIAAISQTLATGTGIIRLPVAATLAKGMYIVTVEIDGEKYNYKVVK